MPLTVLLLKYSLHEFIFFINCNFYMCCYPSWPKYLAYILSQSSWDWNFILPRFLIVLLSILTDGISILMWNKDPILCRLFVLFLSFMKYYVLVITNHLHIIGVRIYSNLLDELKFFMNCNFLHAIIQVGQSIWPRFYYNLHEIESLSCWGFWYSCWVF